MKEAKQFENVHKNTTDRMQLEFAHFWIYAEAGRPPHNIIFKVNPTGALAKKLGSSSNPNASKIRFGPSSADVRFTDNVMPRKQSIGSQHFQELKTKTEDLKSLENEIELNRLNIENLTESVSKTRIEIQKSEAKRDSTPPYTPDLTETFLGRLSQLFDEMSFLLGLSPDAIKRGFLELKTQESLSDKNLAKLIGFVLAKTREEDIAVISNGFSDLARELPKMGAYPADKQVLSALQQAETEIKNRKKEVQKNLLEKQQQLQKLNVRLKKYENDLENEKKSMAENNGRAQKLRNEIGSGLSKILKSHGIFPKEKPERSVREILSMYWSKDELRRITDIKLVNSIASDPQSLVLARSLLHLQLNAPLEKRCPKCSKTSCDCAIQDQFRLFVEGQLGLEYQSFLALVKTHGVAFPFLGLKTVDILKVISMHFSSKLNFGRIVSGMLFPTLHMAEAYLDVFSEPISAGTQKNIDSMWHHHMIDLGMPEADRGWLIENLWMWIGEDQLEYRVMKEFVERQLYYFTIQNENQNALRSMCESAVASSKKVTAGN